MSNELQYSFDDVIVTKFCYDIYNKKIELQLTGYFDILGNQLFDTPCLWTIKDWKDARCKIATESKFSDLNDLIGIISMILNMKISDNDLMITVETIDDRYLDIIFINPQISLITSLGKA